VECKVKIRFMHESGSYFVSCMFCVCAEMIRFRYILLAGSAFDLWPAVKRTQNQSWKDW
jgi:hypothetical protein